MDYVEARPLYMLNYKIRGGCEIRTPLKRCKRLVLAITLHPPKIKCNRKIEIKYKYMH